jgi:hypothetical protein
MLYCELGVPPISLQIKSRIITLWSKLLSGTDGKICNILYKTANLRICTHVLYVSQTNWMPNFTISFIVHILLIIDVNLLNRIIRSSNAFDFEDLMNSENKSHFKITLLCKEIITTYK